MKSISLLVAQRVFLGLLILFAISILIFFGTQLLPGDVAHAILGQQATPESVAALNEQLHLNRPPMERFLEWIDAIVQGDLGKSLANDISVSALIGERLTNTFFLAAIAGTIAVPFSLFLGIVSVVNKNSVMDKCISWLNLTFISFPDFFLGYVLIFIFSVKLGWVPNLANVHPGMGLGERFSAIALPCLTLVFIVSAHMTRMTKVAILNVLGSSYIEMARLKGLSSLRVVGIHALANAIAPVVTVIVLNLAYLVVGVVVVEVVFVYPGVGQLMVDSVSKRDIPVVQACALIFGATYIALNLVADIVAVTSNPRIRYPK
ncbi:ABC transporter permease [Caballeronia sp. DA-9]|uniref:ABC transporter permease n=1 Tax=Caballeronia sp. DA-9 TaxID=3436237 RepID=UPI003F67DF7B